MTPKACDFVSVSNSSHQGISASSPVCGKLFVGKCSPSRLVFPMLAQDFVSHEGRLSSEMLKLQKRWWHFIHFSTLPILLTVPTDGKIGRGGGERRDKEGDTLLQKEVPSQNTVSRTWDASRTGVLSYFVWLCRESQVTLRQKQGPSQPVRGTLVAVKECQDGPDSAGLLGCLLPSLISQISISILKPE